MIDARGEKDRVLALAARMFGGAGYDAVKLEDVAQVAQLDRTALSRLCFSKEDLFFQVLRREVDGLVEGTRDALAHHAALPGAVLRQMATDVLLLADDRPLIRGLMVGRFDDRLATWKDRLHELRTRCLAIPEQVLRQGMQAGLVRKDLMVELTAQFILELHVMSYAFVSDAPDAAERRNARRQVALEMILRGLKDPKYPPIPPPPPKTAGAAAAVQLSKTSRPGGLGTGEHKAPDLKAPPRERLLDAAARIGLEKGIGHITLEAACGAAGASPTDELQTREQLVYAMLERDVQQIVEAVSGANAEGGSAMDLFRAMSERSFEAMQQRPLVLSLITGAAAEALPGREAALSELLQRMAEVLKRVMDVGMAQGLFRKDLPPPLVGRVLLELHMAGHLLFYRPGADLKMRAMQRRVAAFDMLFRGIAAPGAL